MAEKENRVMTRKTEYSKNICHLQVESKCTTELLLFYTNIVALKWNALPTDIQEIRSLPTFKADLKMLMKRTDEQVVGEAFNHYGRVT